MSVTVLSNATPCRLGILQPTDSAPINMVTMQWCVLYQPDIIHNSLHAAALPCLTAGRFFFQKQENETIFIETQSGKKIELPDG